MQLTCPHCRSILEADVAPGVELACPVCERDFVAGDGPLRTTPSAEPTPVGLSSRPTWLCEICGTDNAAGTVACEFCEGRRSATPRSGRRPGRGVPVPARLQVGEVLGTTMKIFLRHVGLLVAVTLLELILLLIFILPLAIIGGLLARAAQAGGAPLQLALVLFFFVAVVMAWIIYQAQHSGHYVFMLKVARGQKAGAADLFGHTRASSKQVLLSFIVAAMIVLGLVALIIPGLVVLTLSWPYGRLVVDRNPPGWSSIGESFEMVRPHFGTVMMLGLIVLSIQYLLSVLPLAFLFTVPFGSLALTVAYLRMRGEPTVADIELARRREQIEQPLIGRT